MTKSIFYKIVLIVCFSAGFFFIPEGPAKEALTHFLAGVGLASISIFSLDMIEFNRRLERD